MTVHFDKQLPSKNVSRAYVWPASLKENVIADMALRRQRPHQVWKPQVAAILKEMGVEYQRLEWSQYAGCSCPCSPGFIVRGHRGADFHFEDRPAPVESCRYDR